MGLSVYCIGNGSIEIERLLGGRVLKIEMLYVILAVLMLSSCGNYYNEENESLDEQGNNQMVAMDDFTKDFIVSDQQVVKGFYLFKSITEGYTLLFPESAKVEKGSYERDLDVFESVGILDENESTNLSFYYKVNYDNQPRANDIDSNLRILSTYTNFAGEYKEIVLDGITYYYGEHVLDYKGRKLYQYFAYIKPENSAEGVGFVGDVTCYDPDKPCSADSAKNKERILKIMHSLKFTDSKNM